MAEGHEAANHRSRKPYHKPEIARVDLVEDEVALSSCKKAVPTAITSSGQSGTKTCKSTCKNISPT